MQRFALFAVAMMLAGCAVPTTGVVPQNNGLMTITRQGEGFWVTTASLSAQTRTDAAEHCKGLGKTSNVIHSKEIQSGALGRWPEAEILFKCE